MIKKSEDEVVAYVLEKCAEGGVKQVLDLIKLYIGYTEDQYNDVRLLHTRIVGEIRNKNLASVTEDGYRISANASTFEVMKEGGYIVYIAHLRDRERLRNEADEARNKLAIIQFRRVNWAFGLSIVAIAVSISAVIVAMCK